MVKKITKPIDPHTHLREMSEKKKKTQTKEEEKKKAVDFVCVCVYMWVLGVYMMVHGPVRAFSRCLGRYFSRNSSCFELSAPRLFDLINSTASS